MVLGKLLGSCSDTFNLVECFYFDSKTGYRYLDEHLSRLAKSAADLAFVWSKALLIHRLDELSVRLNANRAYKIRIALKSSGEFFIFHQLISESIVNKLFNIAICRDKRVNSRNILFQHKTTADSTRQFYNSVYHQYAAQGIDEVIFLNEREHITEGSKTNVFIKQSNRWFTSPVSCGLLPGIMRSKFIIQKKVIETVLTLQDIVTADEIWLTNSIIGAQQAKLVAISSGK